MEEYTLDKDEQELEGYFDALMEDFEQFGPNYSVAPSHTMPVVGQNREGQRTIRPFRWGLLPFWAKEEKVSYSMFIAKAESIDSKKSYKQSFERHRCLVPTSGFYEWTGPKGDRTPIISTRPTRKCLPSRASITCGNLRRARKYPRIVS